MMIKNEHWKKEYYWHDFKSVNNMRDLIQMITSVSSDRIQMTIFEGLKMQEIAILFEEKMDMDVEKFLSLCYDENLISSLGLKGISNLEGYLYPDTYMFLKTYTESDVIKIIVKINPRTQTNFGSCRFIIIIYVKLCIFI